MSNPTFPIVQPPGAIVVSEGMTMRDHFAGLAMQVFLAPSTTADWMFEHYGTESVSVAAYAQADAMLAARAAGAEPEAE